MFSVKTLRFMESASGQSPEWLSKHRDEYELVVKEPQKSLLLSLTPVMEMHFPGIRGTASRLVGTSRFRRDPGVVRDHIWITFIERTDKLQELPAFFFELHPDRYRYGMGFYNATLKKMGCVRAAIDVDPDYFQSIIQKFTNNELQGDVYRKNKAEHLPEQIANWYNRKSFYIQKAHPIDDLLFSPELSASILDYWALSIPLYEFLRKA